MRARQPHRTGKVDRDGVAIAFEEFGRGARTILFVPTWSLVHSRLYKAQVPWFSEHYRVLTYDPRGNGASDRPDDVEQYTIDRTVDDVFAVLDATGTDRAILYGFSFSGQIAAMAAAHCPERVEGLVTIGATCPLVPPYAYRSPEMYAAERTEYVGWQKYSRAYWRSHYADFADFFIRQIFVEPHSTRQIEDCNAWAAQTTGEVLVHTIDGRAHSRLVADEAMYRRIRCPSLIIAGARDACVPPAASRRMADLIGARLEIIDEAGHAPHVRFPARLNLMVRDFLAALPQAGAATTPERAEAAPLPARQRATPRVLYLSSPIGLGHGRRDLAIADALRATRPDVQVDWLAQDPVTRLLAARGESIHPVSARLASESAHFEALAGEHDLHAFQALRRMDEILVANFMRFQEVLEQQRYDLVIADEAWDVDHFWHEHPELKRSRLAWLTDFVGFVPMGSGGAAEIALTTDYNAEMIGHVARSPGLRDMAIFVGNPNDVVDLGFGDGLPRMRDWIDANFAYSGYIASRHPSEFGSRGELRERFGFGEGERVCIVAVGGSGVGAPLIRRILTAYPLVRARVPGLRLRVVTGPRLDPASLDVPAGVECLHFEPELDQQLAACDLALVQGGLTTCMELAAAGTPFLYFPLANHFEQQVHVAHRLSNYRAGRRMDFADADPDRLADEIVDLLRAPVDFVPVETGGAQRVAQWLAALL